MSQTEQPDNVEQPDIADAEAAALERIKLIEAETLGGDVRDAMMGWLISGPLRNFCYPDLKEAEQRQVESDVREFGKQLIMRISEIQRSFNVARLRGEIRGVTLTEGGKLNVRFRMDNNPEAWALLGQLKEGPVMLIDLTSYNLEAQRKPWTIAKDQPTLDLTPGTEPGPGAKPKPGEPDMNVVNEAMNGPVNGNGSGAHHAEGEDEATEAYAGEEDEKTPATPRRAVGVPPSKARGRRKTAS